MRYLLFILLIASCGAGAYYYTLQEKELSPTLVRADIDRLQNECKGLEESLKQSQLLLTATEEEIKQAEASFSSQYKTVQKTLRKEEELAKAKNKAHSLSIQNELKRLREQRNAIEVALEKKQILLDESLQILEDRMNDESAEVNRIISMDWRRLNSLKKEHQFFRGRQSGNMPNVVAVARNNMTKKHLNIKREEYETRLQLEGQIQENETQFSRERGELITLLRKIDQRTNTVKNIGKTKFHFTSSTHLLERLEEEYKFERKILTDILHDSQIEHARIGDELESKRFEVGTVLCKKMEENSIRLSDIKRNGLIIIGILATLTLFAFIRPFRSVSSFS